MNFQRALIMEKLKFFRISEIIWAIICATAMLCLSSTMVFGLGLDHYAEGIWIFDTIESYIYPMRIISIAVIGICILFYPSK